MPSGAGDTVLPDRKQSHWHVNIITVSLSPGGSSQQFSLGSKGVMDRLGKMRDGCRREGHAVRYFGCAPSLSDL